MAYIGYDILSNRRTAVLLLCLQLHALQDWRYDDL